MLISDFPVRSVHLFGERLFGALFPLCGWMPADQDSIGTEFCKKKKQKQWKKKEKYKETEQKKVDATQTISFEGSR